MEKEKEKIDPAVGAQPAIARSAVERQPKSNSNLHRNSTWVVKSRASAPKGYTKLSTSAPTTSPRESDSLSGNKRAVGRDGTGRPNSGNRGGCRPFEGKCNTCGQFGHRARDCRTKKSWKASSKDNKLVAESLAKEQEELEGKRDAFDDLGDVEIISTRLDEALAELEELKSQKEEEKTLEEKEEEERMLAIATKRREAIVYQIASIKWDRATPKGLPTAALSAGVSSFIYLLLRQKYAGGWKEIAVIILKKLAFSFSIAVAAHLLDALRRWWCNMSQWHHPPKIECGFKFEKLLDVDIGGDGRPDALSPCEIVHEDPKLAEVVYYEEGIDHHLESEPITVSLEAAAQVAHHANLSPQLKEETVAIKVDMALGKLMTMNQDRFSYVGPDNIITATSRLVYGIRKATEKKARDNGLPFWLAGNPTEPWDMATDTGKSLWQALALSKIATSAWSNTTGKNGLLYMLASDLISKVLLSPIRTRMM